MQIDWYSITDKTLIAATKNEVYLLFCTNRDVRGSGLQFAVALLKRITCPLLVKRGGVNNCINKIFTTVAKCDLGKTREIPEEANSGEATFSVHHSRIWREFRGSVILHFLYLREGVKKLDFLWDMFPNMPWKSFFIRTIFCIVTPV